MTSPPEAEFDVFLSYNSADRPPVAQIAQRLREEGMRPWWDRWNLTAGRRWQEEIARGLRASKACAVLVGPSGLGAWAREELDVALDRATREGDFPLFMVLLPGAPDPSHPSLDFLRMRTWVDLRAGIEQEAGIGQLIEAITGTARRGEPIVTPPGVCPYPGLAPFGEDDADLFFGRERDVALVMEKLRASRFLAVLGPSGSGKSSLIRAGCIPSLRRGGLPTSEGWALRVFTPGARPLTSLAVQLTRLFPNEAVEHTVDRMAHDARTLDLTVSVGLADSPSEQRVVLVVDQFEEVFTLSADDERHGFLDNLLYAATVPGGRVIVVIGMRADFYPRCAAHRELAGLVADRQFLVGPLDAEGLQRAVEQPAVRAGLALEPGLSETILGDVADHPGALPLLEHVLVEVWRRREGNRLTLKAYAVTGGVAGALERRAEDTYRELTEDQKAIARRVLLRLVQPGEGSEDTRRRAEMSELSAGPGDKHDVEAVVRMLADQRLLTVGRDEIAGTAVVELTHEALIRGWPRFRAWIEEDREALRSQRRLTQVAAEWDRGGRTDDTLLYRGARLAEWKERDASVLSDRERAFLDASAERERDEIATARRRTRRSRQLSGVLAVLLVLALIGGGVAIRQRQVAAEQRQEARSAQLSTQAAPLMASRPDLAGLLSVEAFRAAPTDQARRELTSLSALPQFGGSLTGHAAPLTAVAYSARGLVATASQDRTVNLWDGETGTRAGVLVEHTEDVDAIAFSADGEMLASGGKDRKVVLWAVESRSRLAVLTQAEPVNAVAFSPDGRLLAAVDGRRVVLWDVERRRELGRIEDAGGTEADVAFSPDGQLVAVASAGVAPTLFDVGSRQPVTELRAPDGRGARSLEFTADGRQLAAADGQTVTVWDMAGRSVARELSVDACCVKMAVSSRGRLVAAGSKEIVIWDVASGSEIGREPLPESFPAQGFAFSPDGRRLAMATMQTLHVWRETTGRERFAGYPVYGSALAPDGRLFATAGGSTRIRFWDVTQRAPTGKVDVEGDEGVTALAFHPRAPVLAAGGQRGTIWWWDTGTRAETSRSALEGTRRVMALAFSPDGRVLAIADEDGQIELWDPERKQSVARLDPGPVTEKRFNPVETSIVFSPDGTKLFTANDDSNRVLVWDMGRRSVEATLEADPGYVGDIALRPDGRLLASGGEDGRIVLWDVGRRARVGALTGHTKAINGLAFSPDGRQLVSGAWDDALLTWDVARRRRVARTDLGFPARLTFAEGGRSLLAFTGIFALAVDQVRVVDLDGDRVTKRICDNLRRSLTRQEWETFVPGQPYRETCRAAPS